MRLLVEFSHPADVHKFKFLLRDIMACGHDVLVLSRDIDVMVALLENEGLPHVCISRAGRNLWALGLELVRRELLTLYHVIRFRPTIIFTTHSVAAIHVGWLCRIPTVVHDDTEHARLQQSLYFPFATRVITTTSYTKEIGRKQIRLNSLEPLLYLHPKYFQPDRRIPEKYGLKPRLSYAVVRLISWEAAHDRDVKRMCLNEKRTLLAQLATMVDRVILSTEGVVDIQNECITEFRPQDLHHLLAFASICITEGSSVANEAAILGIPTILVNPLKTGNTEELEKRGLIVRTQSARSAIASARHALDDTNIQQKLSRRVEKLIAEKQDMNRALKRILKESER